MQKRKKKLFQNNQWFLIGQQDGHNVNIDMTGWPMNIMSVGRVVLGIAKQIRQGTWKD